MNSDWRESSDVTVTYTTMVSVGGLGGGVETSERTVEIKRGEVPDPLLELLGDSNRARSVTAEEIGTFRNAAFPWIE